MMNQCNRCSGSSACGRFADSRPTIFLPAPSSRRAYRSGIMISTTDPSSSANADRKLLNATISITHGSGRSRAAVVGVQSQAGSFARFSSTHRTSRMSRSPPYSDRSNHSVRFARSGANQSKSASSARLSDPRKHGAAELSRIRVVEHRQPARRIALAGLHATGQSERLHALLYVNLPTRFPSLLSCGKALSARY